VADSDHIPSGLQSTSVQAETLIVKAFITATTVALAEMANTEVAVREVCHATLVEPWGDIAAVVGIKSMTKGLVVFSVPKQMAAAIAERVLGNVREEVNDTLVRDCLGEIANVIAGQAKTLVAGTPYQLTFSLPDIVVADQTASKPDRARGCLVVFFHSDLGEFTLRLALDSDDRARLDGGICHDEGRS
jgi:chemotaxis protein CheX